MSIMTDKNLFSEDASSTETNSNGENPSLAPPTCKRIWPRALSPRKDQLQSDLHEDIAGSTTREEENTDASTSTIAIKDIKADPSDDTHLSISTNLQESRTQDSVPGQEDCRFKDLYKRVTVSGDDYYYLSICGMPGPFQGNQESEKTSSSLAQRLPNTQDIVDSMEDCGIGTDCKNSQDSGLVSISTLPRRLPTMEPISEQGEQKSQPIRQQTPRPEPTISDAEENTSVLDMSYILEEGQNLDKDSDIEIIYDSDFDLPQGNQKLPEQSVDRDSDIEIVYDSDFNLPQGNQRHSEQTQDKDSDVEIVYDSDFDLPQENQTLSESERQNTKGKITLAVDEVITIEDSDAEDVPSVLGKRKSGPDQELSPGSQKLLRPDDNLAGSIQNPVALESDSEEPAPPSNETNGSPPPKSITHAGTAEQSIAETNNNNPEPTSAIGTTALYGPPPRAKPTTKFFSRIPLPVWRIRPKPRTSDQAIQHLSLQNNYQEQRPVTGPETAFENTLNPILSSAVFDSGKVERESTDVDLVQRDSEQPQSPGSGTWRSVSYDTSTYMTPREIEPSGSPQPNEDEVGEKEPNEMPLWVIDTVGDQPPPYQEEPSTWRTQSPDDLSYGQPDDPPADPSRTTEEGLSLSAEQMHVLDLVVNQRKNVFFTGSAGTGKSILLRELIRRLRYGRRFKPTSDTDDWDDDMDTFEKREIAVTASTGIAACNIRGCTLHSFAGIGLGQAPLSELYTKVICNKASKKRWRSTRTLIIDEVSMIDADLLDKLEALARKVRNNEEEPWGGIQVVLTGDFFQLPPVSRTQEAKFCFEAESWSKTIHYTVELEQIFRQKDQTFAEMLNELRVGKMSPWTVECFSNLYRNLEIKDGIRPTELFPLRRQVDEANNMLLFQLEGKILSFEAEDSGPLKEKMENQCIAPTKLELKVDSQVMLLKNQNGGKFGLANGSIGVVVEFTRDPATNLQGTKDERRMLNMPGELLPRVRFYSENGSHSREMVVGREEWTIEMPDGKVMGRRAQIPLCLAWSLSIHKSQGQTLPRVRVDLGKVFEKGQAYVALSRAISLEGLQVINFDPEKVMVHPKVVAFYKTLKRAAEKTLE